VAKITKKTPLTEKQIEFIRVWKEIRSNNLTASISDIGVFVSQAMKLSVSYVRNIRYAERVKLDLDPFDESAVREGNKPKVEAEEKKQDELVRKELEVNKKGVSIYWIIDEMQKMYDALKDGDPSQRKDKIAILSKLSEIMVKYQGKLQSDIEDIRQMPISSLIERFIETSKVVFQTESVAKLLTDAMLFKVNPMNKLPVMENKETENG
jgi:hypothetical protein